jgi:colicin import membrane protein
MQTRIEASVMTSLVELRQIAEQRAEDERTARERERAAAMARELAAEQAKKDAAEAQVRAEREERIRIEEARVGAERELRLQLEASQAAEQARMQAELEQRRMVGEMELRRADIAKRRPKWMLVVTGLAVVSALGLTVFAVDRMRVADDAARTAQAAHEDREKAREEARASRERVEASEHELADLDSKVQAALKRLDAIKTERERIDEQNRILALQQQQAAVRRHLAEQQAIKDKYDRDHPPDLRECAKEALGCVPRK